MTEAERGVMLLCCALGQSDAQPLSMAQFRTLSRRMYLETKRELGTSRDVSERDLLPLGYTEEEAARIVSLLGREALLDRYLEAMRRRGFTAITRISENFPPVLSYKFGLDAPPVLFCCGNPLLLQRRCIAVVGSRDLRAEGRAFAEKAGRMIAEEDYVLCSGGAGGADRTAQEAALRAGGSVIVFTAGRLLDCKESERILYVSEHGCELPFSVLRALSRNHLIHAMGEKVLVAQTDYLRGGTWHGSMDNLRHGWTPIFVCDDGSEGSRGLCARGAHPVSVLKSVCDLQV